jgi:hypothetical protein
VKVTIDRDAAHDPHGLIASGEPLATMPELREREGFSGKALRALFGGHCYPRPDATGPVVRFVSSPPGSAVPWLYSLADACAAVEAHRGALETRRQLGIDREARDRAAKAARLAARKVPKVKVPKSAPPMLAATTNAPEVLVRRRVAR